MRYGIRVGIAVTLCAAGMVGCAPLRRAPASPTPPSATCVADGQRPAGACSWAAYESQKRDQRAYEAGLADFKAADAEFIRLLRAGETELTEPVTAVVRDPDYLEAQRGQLRELHAGRVQFSGRDPFVASSALLSIDQNLMVIEVCQDMRPFTYSNAQGRYSGKLVGKELSFEPVDGTWRITHIQAQVLDRCIDRS